MNGELTSRFGLLVTRMAERCIGVSVVFDPWPWVLVELWSWELRFGWIPTDGGQ